MAAKDTQRNTPGSGLALLSVLVTGSLKMSSRRWRFSHKVNDSNPSKDGVPSSSGWVGFTGALLETELFTAEVTFASDFTGVIVLVLGEDAVLVGLEAFEASTGLVQTLFGAGAEAGVVLGDPA